MGTTELGTWLRRLHGVAGFVAVLALCLAVATVVVACIPGAPVSAHLPGSMLSGLDQLRGPVAGYTIEPDSTVELAVADASLLQRLLNLAGLLPGLLLVAEVARRMRRLLRGAPDADPFTADTARQLDLMARVTAFGGLVVWAFALVGQWALSAMVLGSGAAAVHLDRTPLVWLAVGLIFAAFGQLVAHGVALRTELDAVV